MIDFKKKYRTRSGLSVQIFCTNRAHPIYPVVGEIGEIGENPGCLRCWTSDGKYVSPDSEYDFDLIEIKAEPIVRWKWVFLDRFGFHAESTNFYTGAEASINIQAAHFKLEYTRTEFPAAE